MMTMDGETDDNNDSLPGADLEVCVGTRCGYKVAVTCHRIHKF